MSEEKEVPLEKKDDLFVLKVNNELREYMFSCAKDSPVSEVLDALYKMHEWAQERSNKLDEEIKDPEIEESKSEEVE